MATEKLTWDSGADWDNSQSENGVVHENVSNTGYTDSSEIRIGYSVENPVPSTNLVGYWPGHESGGSTSYDVSGNGNHGTLMNGAGTGANGILDNNAYYCEASSSDRIEYPTVSIGTSTWTVSQWVYVFSYNSYLHIFSDEQQDNFSCKVSSQDGTPYFYSTDDRTTTDGISENISTNEWTHIAYRYDGDEIAIFLNGSKIVSNTGNYLNIGNFEPRTQGGNGEYADAKHMETRFYLENLSDSEIHNLYDIPTSPAQLVTSKMVS